MSSAPPTSSFWWCHNGQVLWGQKRVGKFDQSLRLGRFWIREHHRLARIGSSGPVFGTLLMTLGKELPESPRAPDFAVALRKSIEALTRLGKAEVGQKTLLDVLDPVQKTLALGGDDLIERVRQCAHESAAATAQMDATRGRSSFLGDRAKGHVDPGSRSMALIISSVCDSLLQR